MSFILAIWRSGKQLGQTEFVLEDSDFIAVLNEHTRLPRAVLIVKVYTERNLSVGRNLALYTIWVSKRHGHSIKEQTSFQDRISSRYVDNWQQYAKERDDSLEKLLPLL